MCLDCHKETLFPDYGVAEFFERLEGREHRFGTWGWGGTGGKMYGMAVCKVCGNQYFIVPPVARDCPGEWSNQDVEQPEKWKVRKAEAKAGSGRGETR